MNFKDRVGGDQGHRAGVAAMSGGRRSIQGVNLASESTGSGQAIEYGPRAVPRDLLVPLWQKHRSLLRDVPQVGVSPTDVHDVGEMESESWGEEDETSLHHVDRCREIVCQCSQ